MKREEFAISLRKKKKAELLREKRKRLLDPAQTPESETYDVCPLFSYDGLMPNKPRHPQLISLRELLLEFAPFLADDYT
jgi:hypothetical protein